MILEWLSAVSAREVIARQLSGPSLTVVSSIPPAHIHAAAVVLWHWKHTSAHEVRHLITEDVFKYVLVYALTLVFVSPILLLIFYGLMLLK